MKVIDIFFTTAIWDEYLECIQDFLQCAERNLKGLVRVDDDCSLRAITICLVCMFDDMEKDRRYGKKIESISPWGADDDGLHVYNLGISIPIPSELFLKFDKIEFISHCRMEFINKDYFWNNKKIKNIDKFYISEEIFNNIC